jgi:hypothetical protein
LFGNAAHQEPIDSRPSVRAHDHEVTSGFLRDPENLRGSVSFL